ncbi:FMRFamide receptor, partial [Biomphalaria glabrata]
MNSVSGRGEFKVHVNISRTSLLVMKMKDQIQVVSLFLITAIRAGKSNSSVKPRAKFVFFNNFQNYSFNNSSYWLRVLNKFPSDDVFRFYHMTCVGDTADMMREVINMFTTKPNTTEPGNPIFGALLYLYVSPVLLILGTLGNLFSFIILRRKQMLKVSSYLYLATLAIVDTVVLYCGLLRHWIRELAQVDIQDTSDGACKFIVTISYVSSDLSAWLITAVTVERYIVVCFPFRASSMCNVSRAKKVIALLIFIILSINVHFLWTVE